MTVRDELVLELARLVDNDALARLLEDAFAGEVKVLGLTILERETIIRALEDAPLGLEQLRATLLAEHVGRKREGLVWPGRVPRRATSFLIAGSPALTLVARA